jgi:predicted DNA binding CopG/RHH family protein
MGDLSGLFDGAHEGKHVSFELRPKDKTISLRLSSDLLLELKKKAEKLGIDYQKYIRIALEGVIFKKAA